MTNMMIKAIDKTMQAKCVSFCHKQHELCLPFDFCLSILFFEITKI